MRRLKRENEVLKQERDILKKQWASSHAASSAIPIHCRASGEYNITCLYRTLDVSVSGYYAWRKRLPSQHSREDAQIAKEVQVAFKVNRQVYSSPRIHAELRGQGRRCGRKQIARLMREPQLSAQLPRHRTITTKSEKGVRVADNVLQQDFHADEPNRKWVTDTTYIWTSEGWL